MISMNLNLIYLVGGLYIYMKEILCFGDSNTYGLIPGTTSRFDRDTRWTGILESELFSKGYKIVEEGLCGRTTIFEDELRDNRRGVDMLPALLESHNPIDYVILMLGTNDCKTYYNASAGLIGKLSILLMSPIVLGDEVWKPEYDPEFNKTSVKTSHKLKDVYKKIAKKYGCHFLAASDAASYSDDDMEHMDAIGHRHLADAILNLGLFN
mgnify:CR=1 FL=1